MYNLNGRNIVCLTNVICQQGVAHNVINVQNGDYAKMTDSHETKVEKLAESVRFDFSKTQVLIKPLLVYTGMCFFFILP